MTDVTQWILTSDEPWTRYRTLVDLLDRPRDDPVVQVAHADMLAHPQVQAMIAEAAAWPGYAFKRHNDAGHPIYKLSTLADFGVRATDPGMATVIAAVLAHQSPEGAFQSQLNIPRTFGGTGEDTWTWVACDAPTLLYALLVMGLENDERVQRAVAHLAGLVDDNGWRCVAAPELGKFKGPGRRTDPCPIANVYALKALAHAPGQFDSPATRAGAAMLLNHWEHRRERKYFLFGMGTDFCKLKYPLVWYDILHVTDVLSRLPFVRDDPRLHEMVTVITSQADEAGRYTASSMYRAWKGWSFADKKQPSPWLTFLVQRVQRRLA
ncbi:MAG: hypothetical protein KKA73_04045 [Chloroflexi bacterium]|nr:hypothetical protein [Chloroflexota bacterium]MBU1746837.1 hypothetical protein [Chloroflexota bacterium]